MENARLVHTEIGLIFIPMKKVKHPCNAGQRRISRLILVDLPYPQLLVYALCPSRSQYSIIRLPVCGSFTLSPPCF